MKNKTLIFFSTFLIFFISISIGKNIYFKKVLQKELSKSLKQDITIKKANLNIFSNSFELKNTILEKDGILVTNLYTKMNFKDYLKDKKNFTIESIHIKDIIFINNVDSSEENILGAKQVSKNEKTSQFLSEFDKQIKNESNLSSLFNSALNRENLSKNTSNNLINFLIKNADFIDIIIQNEVNFHLKNEINSFSKKSKEFIYKIKSSDNENNIFIKSISFSGTTKSINFSGNLENFNTNLSKNISLPINITLKETRGDGIGKIYGDLNSQTFSGTVYLKLSNFAFNSFNEIENYLSSGVVSSEQIININGEIFKIDGTTEINRAQFNKDIILNSKNLDNFKKDILNEFMKLSEQKEYHLKIHTNFSTNTNFINIKTSLPDEIRRILASNRIVFNDFLQNQLKNEYKNSFEDKKNKIKNFFKNIF
ncbi:hypothetical protein [Cetobacterium sp.]|uniref:hypothetical protein n=1 Tax=Cetobacterium sp. TaxID=2071632 RepID=UPI003F3F10EE